MCGLAGIWDRRQKTAPAAVAAVAEAMTDTAPIAVQTRAQSSPMLRLGSRSAVVFRLLNFRRPGRNQ